MITPFQAILDAAHDAAVEPHNRGRVVILADRLTDMGRERFTDHGPRFEVQRAYGAAFDDMTRFASCLSAAQRGFLATGLIAMLHRREFKDAAEPIAPKLLGGLVGETEGGPAAPVIQYRD